jgi:hypothetical protein
MIQLNAIGWFQWLLIGVGVLFQGIAICKSIWEPSSCEDVASPFQEKDDSPVKDEVYQMPEAVPPVKINPMPKEKARSAPPMMMTAGQLMKTAKVTFVQTFKFRQPGS